MEFGVLMFPADYAMLPDELAEWPRSAGSSRCSSPSTRTSRPAARRPTARRRAAARVLAHLRSVRRADRRRRGDRATAGRDRHLPGRRARPDHDREGGGDARPALWRALPVRRRRRLERRGDGATTAPTRARRFGLMRERIEAMKAIWTQDEAATTAATSTSSPSGPGRSRSRARTRRSSSAATGRRVLDRVVAFGDEWMPNHTPSAEALEAESPSSAGWPKRPAGRRQG